MGESDRRSSKYGRPDMGSTARVVSSSFTCHWQETRLPHVPVHKLCTWCSQLRSEYSGVEGKFLSASFAVNKLYCELIVSNWLSSQ